MTRPTLKPNEETYHVTLRLAASDYDALHEASGGAVGVKAREIVQTWLCNRAVRAAIQRRKR